MSETQHNPFSAPEASPEEAIPIIGPEHRADAAAYRPLQRRAWWTNLFLSLAIIINLASVGAYISQFGLLQAAQNGTPVSENRAAWNDAVIMGLAGSLILVCVITAVCFCMWGYRAYANLAPLGARGLQYSPRWAVGAFFVPIMNLVRPYQIYTEVWKASDPQYPSWNPRIGHTQGAILVNLWWGLWIGGVLVERFAGAVVRGQGEETINGMLVATGASIFSSALEAGAGLMGFLMVRGITSNQADKLAIITEMNKPADIKNVIEDW